MKHYNAGNVWGIIKKVEEKETVNGKKYLRISLNCVNDLYGAVFAYVTMWGENTADSFLAHYKDHPASAYHFAGLLSQYEKEGKIYTNYSCFDWQVYENTEYRASFVLSGAVTGIDFETNKINLLIERKYDNETKSEAFELYIFDEDDLQGISINQTVRVKGMMRAKEPADYYSGLNTDIKPYIMRIVGER